MKQIILALAALGLMSAFTVRAGDTGSPEQIAKVTAIITSDSEKARAFVQALLNNMGDTSGVGDCSVFVKKKLGGNGYLVAKVILETNGVQNLWRAVVTPDLSYSNIVPEAVWQYLVKKDDDKPLRARVLDPNS